MNEKLIIRSMVKKGIKLVSSNKVDLDTIITTDRLLVELIVDDNFECNTDVADIYYRNEYYIHDAIELVIIQHK